MTSTSRGASEPCARPGLTTRAEAPPRTIESMALPTLFALGGRRIFVAGHRGMVGSALIRRMAQENCQILTAGRDQVDLRAQWAVDRWIYENHPEAEHLLSALDRHNTLYD